MDESQKMSFMLLPSFTPLMKFATARPLKDISSPNPGVSAERIAIKTLPEKPNSLQLTILPA